MYKLYLLLAACIIISSSQSYTQQDHSNVVNIMYTLNALISEEDTDDDKKITIDDKYTGNGRGDKRFAASTSWIIKGTYYLSNLLQELKLAEETGALNLQLDSSRIYELPADRISRLIKDYYWDGLTRSMDESGLVNILNDEKTKTEDEFNYIYTPQSDNLAYEYYSNIKSLVDPHLDKKLKVIRLEKNISAGYVQGLNGRHGPLSLAVVKKNDKIFPLPFVVPGGRFNEMYGWDSYFITIGLLHDKKIQLAKSMVDNFIYEINNYGKILNANRTYYLTRSQPPFLTSMIREVYKYIRSNPDAITWLREALTAAIKEYEEVWTGKDHITHIGLSRYFDTGTGIPPEVEPGHFDALFALYAAKYKMTIDEFESAYKSGEIIEPKLDEYFIHDRAMRESGHDTSYRLIGLCADLATADLNSLLYKIEMDIAVIIKEEFGGQFKTDKQTYNDSYWFALAKTRKDLMNKYLWNEETGLYYDFNVKANKQNVYVSAAMFYPLWAGAADSAQASSLVKSLLPSLEFPGGIAGSTEESRGSVSEERPQRQWDYPYGWAPHQVIAWQGLLNYGYKEEAERLIYKWLYTITSNAADYNGTVPEKFDVVKRSHEVFAEYGNVGIKFAYITREGFGWTNASYKIGLYFLSPEMKTKLNNLVPPEDIFNN